jgi:capsular polysaccharide transport system permease protein
MKLKVNRFRIRKPDPVASPPLRPVPMAKPVQQQVPDDLFMPDPDEDGFGNQSFVPAAKPAPAKVTVTATPTSAGPTAATTSTAGPTAANPAAAVPQDIESIRHEGLTGRQLRMARRLAQKHGLPATSDFDAVRLLRDAGIDPFQRSALLELVAGGDDDDDAAGTLRDSTALTISTDPNRLPQIIKSAPLPSTEVRAEESHAQEVRRIQAEIVARRRRKLALMWTKIAVFVLLPTFVAAWYYYLVATPMYSSRTEFVIQQATASSAVSSLFTGTSFATSQDSVAVQGYLQSQDVMQLLDKDSGFRQHFSDPSIDPIQRLAPDANNSAAYALYKKVAKISYDPTEGIIKMEVSATDPAKAVEFSRALLKYAETRVDQLTARLRGDQEKSAAQSFADAQANLELSQRRLVELQQKFKTFSSEVEAGMITSQIGSLDVQLTQEKLSLAQMEANANPNKARMDPVKARIGVLEAQIAELRLKLTESGEGGPSIAAVQSELVMAQADVTTRQMMLAQATSAMETSRIEANRQTRYLEVSVQPVAADDPSYPRAFENSIVVLLIFGGIYLMVSMTIAILREQVSN